MNPFAMCAMVRKRGKASLLICFLVGETGWILVPTEIGNMRKGVLYTSQGSPKKQN